MKGIRYVIRNFTPTAVKEHLRSQIEDAASPELTPREIELVRFVREGSFDWDAFLAGR
jgi:DNA-binding NarL/FixJ family response regulator